MPKLALTAPKKKDLQMPECTGCSQCGDAWEDHLYILGRDKKYYCKICFFKIAVKWPKPGGRSDSDSQAEIREVQGDGDLRTGSD